VLRLLHYLRRSTVNAFIKTESGLFKVYRHGDDWQIVGPRFERWFSVWQSDRMGSLMRAIDAVPGLDRQIEIVSLN
jgi:hypothetical protein